MGFMRDSTEETCGPEGDEDSEDEYEDSISIENGSGSQVLDAVEMDCSAEHESTGVARMRPTGLHGWIGVLKQDMGWS